MPLVSVEAVRDLVTGAEADVSRVGIVLTATSLLVMPVLGVAKQRLARQLSSRATHGEGTQNLLCAYLSAAVLAGLLGSALLGLWWLDPLAALVVAAVARGGLEAWRGEGCFDK